MSKVIMKYKLPDQEQKVTITALAWSPDGRLLAACVSQGDIQIWDTKTQQLKYSLTSACAMRPCLTWSPDSRLLAVHTSDEEKAIKFWDIETGQQWESITAFTQWIACLAWSPDGSMLAGGSTDGTIRLWDIQTCQHIRTLSGHMNKVSCLLWFPEGDKLVSGSSDRTICMWDTQTGRAEQKLVGHFHEVSCLAWLTCENLIASGSYDRTIRIWDPNTGHETNRLEAHTAAITDISAFNGGHLLASKAETVRIWSTETWEPLERQEVPPSNRPQVALAFSPCAPLLALVHEDSAIWILDTRDEQYPARRTAPEEKVVHYTNAKVVLVGEQGVGKSGLALVLAGEPFRPTPSTHGRQVFSLKNPSQERKLEDGIPLETDTLVWDLAGQSGYRLIHQLHLNEVAVALILFDYHNDTDPFASVGYWNKALSLARKAQGTSAIPIKKLLVAARSDVGGRKVNQQRIDEFCQNLGFDGYHETSAKEKIHTQELIEDIKAKIDWDVLPRLTSPRLFQSIKNFLLSEREHRILASVKELEDLYRAFLAQQQEHFAIDDLSAQFETCINLVESSGLIHRLRGDNYILLRPELIDAYASALANSVSGDPDGSGSILEQDVYACNFALPQDIRVADQEQEKRLLFAMIEDLIRSEIILRDQGYLIFPSQSTKEHPEMPDLKEKMKTVTFTFEGPVANIYAVLTVRLSRSGTFIQPKWWKNAVVYTTVVDGAYGIFLDNYGEGRGKITLFCDSKVCTEICVLFENFIEKCLKQITLTLVRERVIVCEQCGEIVDAARAQKRRDKGFNWILCGLCESNKRIRLDDDPITSSRRVEEMSRAADEQLIRELDRTSLEQKRAMGRYDVFMSYNKADTSEVQKIAEQLKDRGHLPFDEAEIPPGSPWQREIEAQIRIIPSAAVFIGKHGIGPWHHLEMDAFLNEFTKRSCPVIPIFLLDAPEELELPPFLERMRSVDFRKSDPDPLEQLIWGITGEKDR